MHTYFVADRRLAYEGVQLAPHWIYRSFDLLGDAIVGFVGPCQVEMEEMVDLEDVKAEASIYSPLMLHCIAEFFDTDLELAICRQRLLMVTAKELLEELTDHPIHRQGDDLYFTDLTRRTRKLSVSIATASVTSTLIHSGFNIETEGTPVPTVGLNELNVPVNLFGEELLKRFAAELDGIRVARYKVKAVSE